MRIPFYPTLLFLFASLLWNHDVHAQIVLPELLISKYQDGQLYLRWEPASIQEWKESFSKGYTIEIYGEQGQKLSVSNIKPRELKQFQADAKSAPAELFDFYEACMGFLYLDKTTVGKEIQNMADHMVQNTEHTLDSFRLSMLSARSKLKPTILERSWLSTSHFKCA